MNDVNKDNQIKFLHDLSSPLMVATGTIESLIKDPSDSSSLSHPEVQVKLNRIKRALDKLTLLVKNEKSNLRAQRVEQGE